MTRLRFVLPLAALVVLAAQPVAAQSSFDTSAVTAAKKEKVRGGPAPLIGAGLPVIVGAGAAFAGYRLWRRKVRRTDNS
jgi:hypothetical protein